MDELKLRLEYLEAVSDSCSAQSTMMDQVAAIEATMDQMLGVRRQEAQRMADELRKRSTADDADADAGLSLLSVGRGGSAAAAGEAGEASVPGVPADVKRAVVESRLDDLSRLATELEAQHAFEMPKIRPPPDPRELLQKASALGQEFDELTVRSAELTKRLMDKLAEENAALGGVSTVEPR